MEYGSAINEVMGNSRPIVPAPGMGATELLWSDRRAYTIIAVSPSGKKITLQADTATRTDTHGMSDCQDWAYAPNPDGPIIEATLRKDGRWRRVGFTQSGVILLGVRDEHYDFSF